MTAQIKIWFGPLAASLGLLLPVGAEPIKTLDLKQWVTPSPFDNIGTPWLLPKGHQVIDGVPFQIDGIVLMYGDYSAQRNRISRTNVNGIAVGSSFECLHLLVTTQSKAPDGTPLTRIKFAYADGSSNSVEVAYGVHVRNWFGPWHTADQPLADTGVREVWRALASGAATSDNYLRMYHVVFTNPSPAKVVRTMSLESLKKPSGLMIAAMSVGPRVGDALPDTVAQLKSLFPDLRPRSGETARGEGIIRTIDGEPIAGATVRVSGVRGFTEGYNDSHTDSPEVGAQAITGANGKFVLPALPDNLLHKLIVLADGYEAYPYGGLDVKSDPIEIRLKPLPAPGKYAIHARIVDLEGHPVVGASIEPEGVSNSSGGTSWGGSQGFPEQLLAGTNGEFVISRKEEFTRLQLNITAPGLAPTKLWLPASNTVQTIEMGPGALLRGRVVKNGNPLGGLKIGVSGAERNSEVYAGHYEAKTDNDGVFSFNHLPTNVMWYVYGIMSSLKPHGAIPAKPVQTTAHGATNDLGDVEVTTALRLSGQVVTRSGEPLPKGVKVRIGHEQAWDSQTASVDRDGKFSLDGLYKGQVDVSIEPREWHLSSVNRSLDLWNGWRMTGLLQQDKDDMLMVIEKGQFNYNNYSGANGQLPGPDWPQNRSLAGAEASGPSPIILAGQVLDDKSGQPLSRFKVLPGYKPPSSGMPPPAKPLIKSLVEPFTKKTIPWNEQPYWKFAQMETFSNGTFAVSFVPLSSTPMLRIEADGYQSIETTPTNITTSNIVVRLKIGAGPNGVVLLPDGKPAEGAAVYYAANKEGFSLESKKLRSYDRNNGSFTTGKDGKFNFPARAHGEMIFVAHPSGWAQESVESGGENLKLKLQPWAVVIGTLVDTNGQPMSGVELEVSMPNDWQRGDPRVYIPARATTDAQGKFRFVDVPPVRLDVNRIMRMTANSWSTHPQTWFSAQPGTNDLGKVTYDRPPPPSMLEQIKKSIGL